jgi:5'-nucleotidase
VSRHQRTGAGPLWVLALAALLLALSACATGDAGSVRLAILGTNDVHGQLLPDGDRGGITVFSGYVNALRQSGDADAVLVVDAGDMWQGTLASNLDEGASVVDAYNAIGYAAAAVGNHEFDFGPSGALATPASAADDPRGALRARAREADFPLLAANLVVADSGLPPDWQNVHAAVMVPAGGLKVGIIGLLTTEALGATIAANVDDLEVTPLAEAAGREAARLRERGADVVVIAAHAGGRCDAFDDALDLASCNRKGEIFRLAEALPAGFVDLIVGGHKHHGIAHVVNDIPIVSGYSRGQAFSRVDLVYDPAQGRVVDRQIYPPRALCAYEFETSAECATGPGAGVVPVRYAGRIVEPDAEVVRIAAAAGQRAGELRERALGVTLTGPFTLENNPESSLGNLFTRAMLAAIGGDVAIHNVTGGLRAGLPAGPLTYGAVYEMFPFDNRVVVLELTGRDLRRIAAAQAQKDHGRAALAGLRLTAACRDGGIEIAMELAEGTPVRDSDRLTVVANDFLALGGDGIFAPVLPPGGFDVDGRMPLVRDVFVDWLEEQPALDPAAYGTGNDPYWRIGPGVSSGCADGAAPGQSPD